MMSQKTSYSHIEIEDLADGGEDFSASYEPASRLRTSVLPVVLLAADDGAKPAEAITTDAADIRAEGIDDNETQDAALEGGSPEASAKSHKVLIVEDTLELAEVIQATLERLNIETMHETHGNKAMQKFLELDPDVVLLDISLPDTTGWKIMDLIKERLDETKGKMPKVIVITAYDDPANRLIGKLQGVHNYLIKPFTADQIEQMVQEALGMGPNAAPPLPGH